MLLLCSFGKKVQKSFILSLMWFVLENLSRKFGSQVNDILDSFGSDFSYPVNLPSYVEEYFEEQQDTRMDMFGGPIGRIRCLPLPGKVYFTYYGSDYWEILKSRAISYSDKLASLVWL